LNSGKNPRVVYRRWGRQTVGSGRRREIIEIDWIGFVWIKFLDGRISQDWRHWLMTRD
jgi:hypothetical protein